MKLVGWRDQLEGGMNDEGRVWGSPTELICGKDITSVSMEGVTLPGRLEKALTVSQTDNIFISVPHTSETTEQ